MGEKDRQTSAVNVSGAAKTDLNSSDTAGAYRVILVSPSTIVFFSDRSIGRSMRTQIEVHVKFRGGSIGGINWRGQSRSEGRRFACTLAVAGLAKGRPFRASTGSLATARRPS